MQTALHGKIKERKGEWVIGASTQNLLYLSIVATQHKTKRRRVLIIGKARRRIRRVLIMGKARKVCNLADSNEGTVNYFDDDRHENEKMEVILAIQEYKRCLSESSRTSKLWIQYIYYIVLLKDFIFAERTRNWRLHLVTVKRILNLFASAV